MTPDGTDAPASVSATVPDTLPCPWARVDPRGTILQVNRRLVDLSGREASALVGRSFDRLLTPASCVLYQVHLQPLLRLQGETAELALTVAQAGGGSCDVLVYGARVDDGPESPVDLMLAPIRRRREIEGELLRIKRAADQAPGLLFELERRPAGGWRFRYANAALGVLYGVGITAASRDADPVFARLTADDRARLEAALEAAAAGCGSRCVTVRRDDSARLHEWRFEAAPDSDRRPVWRGYVADVTDQHQAEEAERRRADAERRVRMHAEFLARASHELRTPLNAILGFAQILGRGGGPEPGPPSEAESQRRRTAGVIEHAGRHLLRLVDRLLDIAGAQRRDAAPALVPVPLFPLVDGCLARAALEGRDAGIALTLRCVPDVHVLADETALQQVLDNLLSNAVKYNRPGGRIALEVRPRDGDVAEVVVADTGLGLDAAQLARLFEPFNRLGAERTAVPGVGLGLVIARQLTESMGGELLLASEPGSGTTARLRLRAAAVPPRPVVEDPPPAPATAAGPCGGTVLYVEDDPVNALLMRAVLEARPGIVFELATTAGDACRAAAGRPFDLLLVDLHLPDGRGDELLQRLRAVPAQAAAAAVLVTAAAGEDTRRLAATAGFDGCWTKPLDVARVLDDVDRLLASRRAAP